MPTPRSSPAMVKLQCSRPTSCGWIRCSACMGRRLTQLAESCCSLQSARRTIASPRVSKIHVDNESTYEVLTQVEYLMLELRPPDPRRRSFLQQSLLHADKIGTTHWPLRRAACQ